MTFDDAQSSGCAQGYFFTQRYFGHWIQVQFQHFFIQLLLQPFLMTDHKLVELNQGTVTFSKSRKTLC
jgi:hypothetical protein